MEKTMDKIVALAKARGFVYPGSEIYAALQIHGIMVISVSSLRTMLRKHGGRNLFRRAHIM